MAQISTLTEHGRHLAEFVQKHREVWHPDGSSCKILKAITAESAVILG